MQKLASTIGDIGILKEAMAEEEHRFRSEIKRVAYEYETEEDPRSLEAAIREISEETKRRQAEILRESGWGS